MTGQFSTLLRRLRRQAGMTQEQLAERSGVGVRTIRGFETGERTDPRLATMRLLADSLGLRPDQRDELLATAMRPGAGGSSAPTGPVPRQLPAQPAAFVGRERQLAALSSSAGTVVVGGGGGVGKTWLALHWAHRHLADYPDGQLFADLRGFSPDSEPLPTDVAVRGFLDGLGVPAARVPADLPAQTALYRSLVAGRRMLIVLDNAASADQVVPLLPGGDSCTVLVTSRRALTGLVTRHSAHHLPLDLLDTGEAHTLLAGRVGGDRVAAEPAAVAQLVELCGGLPLALGILAGRASINPGVPLAELAAELREAGLAALSDEDPAASLPAALSWSHRALPPDQQTLFELLAIAPGADITPAAAASLAGMSGADGAGSRPAATAGLPPAGTDLTGLPPAAGTGLTGLPPAAGTGLTGLPPAAGTGLTDLPPAAGTSPTDLPPTAGTSLNGRPPGTAAASPEAAVAAPPEAAGTGLAAPPEVAAAGLVGLPQAKASLAELELVSLVSRDGRGRYAMHDLIRRYATDTAARRQSPEALAAAQRRIVDFYLHTAYAADRLLDPHRPPVPLDPPVAGCHPLPLPDHATALEWLDAEHATVLAAQHTAAVRGWHQQVWQLAWTLGTYHDRRGRAHDRLAVWRAGLAAADALADPAAQIRAHRVLGYAHAEVGQHDRSIEHLGRSLTLAETQRDRTNQAHTHRMLARAWGQRGDHRQALDHATDAFALYGELDNAVWEAEALNEMGWHAARLGEYQRAREHCTAALTLHRHHDNPDGESYALDSLGYVAHHTGEHSQAVDHYRQALALLRDLGYTYEIANTLNGLGESHLALGEAAEARAAWQEALDLYQTQQRPDDAHRLRARLDALG
ncbi:hypothetical protein BLA60_37325 [Actinophytocola xinjiangensis]|uniref:HTH cro/C1-type domain-containing protein n=1 Tax=Actinophytocola xinjiangensis TaxID=485602 RepID=A0A7Z1AV28_9PSEU|nr:tetratricopeptide repeat protein [Actinophytocola xinjiangensis]OLF05181.1 hypothetical protein BLA60_37325 [Actinophytocola xinjiangensis]